MNNELYKLNDENFSIFAAKSYINVFCVDEAEFLEDLIRIKYIKRLLKRYNKTGILKERLILNHLIVFYNVFSIEGATKMLFFKIGAEYHPALKTFLLFLGYLPDRINMDLSSDVIFTSDIPIDQNIVKILRSI